MPSFGVAVESERQSAVEDFSAVELALATRNHGFPLESLRYDLTPIGLHYLLIHFDIPQVDPATWRLEIGGEVGRPLSFTLDELKERPRSSVACTMECAGNGRARLSPRPLSQPWLEEAIGNAEWTGTPLAPLLEEAEIGSKPSEVLFTGLDRGVRATSSTNTSAVSARQLRPEMLLAYESTASLYPPARFPAAPHRAGLVRHDPSSGSIGSRSCRAVRGLSTGQAIPHQTDRGRPGQPVTRIEPRSL